jgi:hypothetical protein
MIWVVLNGPDLEYLLGVDKLGYETMLGDRMQISEI